MDKAKTTKTSEDKLIPSEFRKAGFGEWTPGINGYSRFLEAAIRQSKDAASRCAEKGLHDEYEIFMAKAAELQLKLDQETQRLSNLTNSSKR